MELLNEIPDPEVPAISIVELGVVRDVIEGEKEFKILITPTYSGCPALHAMQSAIKQTLNEKGIDHSIEIVLSPAWTTEWMSDAVKEKLRAYGIAPPKPKTGNEQKLFSTSFDEIACPFCKSNQTQLESVFGSTACKSLHYCLQCQQPFEHFKCH
ncbi:MAG TPA: phenylacetate-CoA oxygenase subunit PaaJ [Bacteroidia bacterium]|nr:phenylacetate-CoA oxygenase subunit PaaJ [Bacteroidia bacterium]HNT79725.1 phenylacetate-CoA oxygenase subunit PaaJ [Bacteroidia bacterium]